MNFTVTRTPTAENELAALWLDPALRDAVTRRSHEIDERLAENVPAEGESRQDDVRIAFAAPLAV